MGGPMRMNPPRGMGGMGPQVGAGFAPPQNHGVVYGGLTSALHLENRLI